MFQWKNGKIFGPWKKLLPLIRRWAFTGTMDAQIPALRRQAIQELHKHFLKVLPEYADRCGSLGILEDADWADLVKKGLSPTEIFKSYDGSWLEKGQWDLLTNWSNRLAWPGSDPGPVTGLQPWIDGQKDRFTIVSSGSSGKLSIVPRSKEHQDLFLKAAWNATAGILVRAKVFSPLAAFFLKIFPFSPKVSSKPPKILRRWDGFFLDFAQGATGNQVLGRSLAPLFREVHSLFPRSLDPGLLSALVRGPGNEDQARALAELHQDIQGKRSEHWDNLINKIQASIRKGQRIFLFGTPVFLLELCQFLTTQNRFLDLGPKSLVLYGGGWKTFQGEKLSSSDLDALITSRLGIRSGRILEGYAMTEMTAVMIRCTGGRFHIPPYLEPLRLGEDWEVQDRLEGQGLFAFLDGAALSYPGWLVSGDEVVFETGRCSCGREGPRVHSIQRSSLREAKGCGGLMGTLKA